MAEQIQASGRLKSQASSEDVGRVFSEQDSEPTKFYQLGNPEAKVRVVMSMRDPGEGSVFLPIVKKLEQDGEFSISIFADGSGAKILENKLGIKNQLGKGDVLVKIAQVISKADLILVSQSSDSGIDMSLVATAKGSNISILAIEDFPGTVSVQDGGVLENRNPLLIPDWQCVMTEWSKRKLLKLRPELNPNRVIVTGSPAFDNVDLSKKEEVKNEFRRKHGIDQNERIIVWVGQMGEADSDSLKLFVENLKGIELDDYRLIIRRHPKDERSNSFFNNVTADLSYHLLDTMGEPIDKVRQAADLVVTMFSTEGLMAVCEQTPTILIMIPEFLRLSGYDRINIPVAEDGSATVVQEKDQMGQVLKDVLFNVEFQKKFKERMKDWKIDGKATERIFNLIKKIVNK